MSNWRFYGREKEVARLACLLRVGPGQESVHMGSGHYVIGRRDVGKTELLEKTLERHARNRDMMWFEFPEEGSGEEILQSFLSEAETQGHQHILADLTKGPELQSGASRLAKVIEHLLAKEVLVVLDEFQNIDRISMFPSFLKQAIDKMRRINGPDRAGELVVAGSHQQRMAHMFAVHRPLHRRVKCAVRLKQWKPGEILEMAAEQGFLKRPQRFLSALTAWGGVPEQWKSLGDNDGGLADSYFGVERDEEWREGFIEDEQTRLQDPEARWDFKGCLTLEPPLHRTLRMLAENPQRGMTVNEILARFHAEGHRLVPADRNVAALADRDKRDPNEEFFLRGKMLMMRDLLEITGSTVNFLDTTTKGRWSIDDNATRFQLHVFPEMFQETADEIAEERIGIRPRLLQHRMKVLEGLAFEKFCAEWVGERHGATWVKQGARRPLPAGLTDVDVLAEIPGRDESSPATLFMGSCKRRAAAHDAAETKGKFEAFVGSLRTHPDRGTFEREKGEEVLAMERVEALFSPEFGSQRKAELEAAGFAAADFRFMAEQLGFKLEPPMQGEGV